MGLQQSHAPAAATSAATRVPPISVGSQPPGGAGMQAPQIEAGGPGVDRNDSSVPLFPGEKPGSFDIYLQLLREEHDELRRECMRLQAQAKSAQTTEVPGSESVPAASAGGGPDSRNQQDAIREGFCLEADNGALENEEEYEEEQEVEPPRDSQHRGFDAMLSELVGDTGASDAIRKAVTKIMEKSYIGKTTAPGVFPFQGAQELKRKLKWVRNSQFALAVSVVIILNAVYMVVQTSVVLHKTRQDTSNQMSDSWIIGDVVFAMIFTAEIVLRVFAYQVKFFNGSQRWWNLFDCVTLLASIIALASDIAKAPPDFFLNFLKLLRLARLVRSLKASKSQRLHVLKTLMYTVAGSANAFLSAILLLVIVISVFGVMFMQGLQNYIRTPDYRQDTRESLERYFGSFADASYTLLACITGGLEWDVVAVPLDHIGVGYRLFLVAYMTFAVLCVLNILNGVFVTAAIESAQSNKELAVESTQHKRQAMVRQMVVWFNEADKDRSGKVTWDELRDIMNIPDVRDLLLASGIDVASAGQIFLLLDRDKSGDLDPAEFVDNLIALQGNAQALDLASLRVVCEETSEKVKDLRAVVHSLVGSSSRSEGSPKRVRSPRVRPTGNNDDGVRSV